ncbi:hypothetical protein ACU6U9_00145 [Pseudomonas sp. HK3]
MAIFALGFFISDEYALKIRMKSPIKTVRWYSKNKNFIRYYFLKQFPITEKTVVYRKVFRNLKKRGVYRVLN